MSWIKFDTELPLKIEVFKISADLGLTQDDVVGKLMRFWGWADKTTEDGIIYHVVAEQALQVVDSLVSHPGFAEELLKIEWLEWTQNKELRIPKYDRHMDESAKKRAIKAERQRKWRKTQVKSKSVVPSVDGHVDASVDGQQSTGTSTREEKRREEKIIEEEKKEEKNSNAGHGLFGETPITPEPRKKVSKATVYPDDFNTFWVSYPNKSGKIDALKAWKQTKADRPSTDAIVQSVQAQARADKWTKDGGQFIPKPATWLRAGSWDDEAVNIANNHETNREQQKAKEKRDGDLAMAKLKERGIIK